ncbi:DUF2508 family protein [Paenibacillus arenilitoris]|uniref:DUF2508 family protein n=1 Tax=Paenibacillus arenilitoris TaxID=2772299 RepID=UPI001CC266BB|nr:DUF2508 family protein [Paenibacillus arenilitoris]
MSNQKQDVDAEPIDKMEQLRREIAEALKEWENANRYFDHAVGKDQVDYAIYAIISAEKRYEMLLRAAKQIQGTWPAWRGALE